MATARTSKITWHRPPEPPVIRDFLKLNVHGRWSDADVIYKMAEQLGWTVEPLPESLGRSTDPIQMILLPQVIERGDGRSVIFKSFLIEGPAAKYFDQFAAKHKMRWSSSGGVLRFDDARADDLSPFDELAGRLMHGAKRGTNDRILPDEYRRITAALDSFRPTDWLEGRSRKALADWNQAHPQVAIKKFSEAYERAQVGGAVGGAVLRLRGAVRRRLNRAQMKYRKAHPEK